MSAWVVDKAHIDLLTRFALRGLGREPFRWWQVDSEGAYAGWRELDEIATGEDAERLTPSQFGQLLLAENIASVSYRYSEPGRTYYYGAEHAGEMEDTPEEDLPGPCDRYYLAPYVYTDPGYTMTPGEVFKAIDCLDYQSCEHPDWRRSEAFALLTSLRERACAMVDGYEAAPWGWDAEQLGKLEGVRDFSRRVV